MASKKQDRLIYESGQLFIQTPTGLDRDVNGEYIGLLDINILGDITVTGNLEVIGDTIDSGRVESSLEVSDKSIQLNRGEPNEGVTNLDGTLSESGITVDRGLTYDTGALDPDTGAPVFADRPADLSQGQYMHPASFAWIEGKTAWSFFSSDLDADDRAYDDTWVHPRLLEIGDPIGNHRPATPTDNYDLAATAIANADDPLLELARSAATVNWVASITNQLEYSVSELANKLPDGTDNDDILLWDTSTSAYVASSFEIEIDSDPVLGGNLDLHGHEIMFSSFGHLQEDIDGIRLTLADNNKFRLAGSAEITAEELLPLDISSHDADINIHTESTTNLNGNILLTAINSGEVRLRSETAIELTAPEVKVVGTLTIGDYGLNAGTGGTPAIWTLPLADGTTNSVMTTDGTGNLSFVNATNTNDIDSIVVRDGAGDFSANIITSDLVGQVTGSLIGNADTSTTLETARNITLDGDVSGTVSFDGSTNVDLTAVVADNSHEHVSDNISDATADNIPNMIVRRGPNGEFSATKINGKLEGDVVGNVTGDIIGNVTGDIIGNVTGDIIGNVTGNLTGVTDTAHALHTARTLYFTGGATGNAIFDGSADATISLTVADGGHTHTSLDLTDATSNATANTIVLRNAAGDFFANNITSDLTGTATNSNSINIVGEETSTAFHYMSFTSGTGNNAILNIDTNVRFTPSTKTLSLANVEANVTGDLTGNATTANSLSTARNITLNGDVSGTVYFDGSTNVDLTAVVADNTHNHLSANISDATADNTPDTVVIRSNTGNFSAGIISADLNGNATTATTAIRSDRVNLTNPINTDGSKYIPFSTGASGDNVLLTDISFYYHNSNKILTAGKFAGDGSLLTGINATGVTVGKLPSAVMPDIIAADTSGNAATADAWSTARNVTLTGGVTGTASVDGSSNINIVTTVVGTDHTHDDLTNATPDNIGNALVRRSASGAISAGTISGVFNGNASSASKLLTPRNISFSGDVSGSTAFDGSSDIVINTTVSGGTHTHLSADITDATDANTANMIVKRDGSGNFSATTITADLSGTAQVANTINAGSVGQNESIPYPIVFRDSSNGAAEPKISNDLYYNPGTKILTARNFNGSLDGNASTAYSLFSSRNITLTGDVTGVVAFNGSDNVELPAVITNNSHNHISANITDATNENTPEMIVKRDAAGSVSVSEINTEEIFIGNSGTDKFYDDAGRTTYSGAGFQILHSVPAYYNYAVTQYQGFATGTTHHYRGSVLTGNSWGITATGDITGASLNSTSSKKYKSSITDMASDKVDNILSLRAVDYTLDSTDKQEFGFIAEEVNELFPEVVVKKDGEVEAMDYSRLISPLVAMVQKQQRQIEEIQHKLAN